VLYRKTNDDSLDYRGCGTIQSNLQTVIIIIAMSPDMSKVQISLFKSSFSFIYKVEYLEISILLLFVRHGKYVVSALNTGIMFAFRRT
jgi:hypothetical protein